MAVVTPEMAQQHTAGELVDQIRQVVPGLLPEYGYFGAQCLLIRHD